MKELLKKPSAWIPIVMSASAFLLIVGYVAMFGVVHHEDEGTPAHLFQLLMFSQPFIMLFFAAKWLLKEPKETLGILLLQILAAFVPFLLLLHLEL